jgi:hypothetical protein
MMAENATGILASTPQNPAGVGISEAPNEFRLSTDAVEKGLRNGLNDDSC